VWSPAGLSSGTLVLPDLCQRHGESEQGSGLCPADDTNIFAEWRDPVELFGRVNGGLWELDRWFRCNSAIVHVHKLLPRFLN
jgi:hypothetical protein